MPLRVIPEEGNKFDENAMIVVISSHAPPEMLEQVTRKGDGKRKPQKVKDILGKQVGRVPANLCRVFRELLGRNIIIESILCYYGGKIGHSKNLHFQQDFKRAHTRQGIDTAGGGAELTCSYFLLIKDDCYEEAVKLFKKRLQKEDIEKFLF